MRKNVAFLLGAGCEGNGQLNLPSGNSFKRDTIVAKDVNKLIYAVNNQASLNIKSGTIISHNSSSILYQTILEYGLNNFSFSGEEKGTIEGYLETKSGNSKLEKDEKEKIQNAFQRIYRERFYNAIKNLENDTEALDKNVRFFLDHACFYSFVDSLFNYLRKPWQYQNEVNRIIKLYYAAYLSIISKLFNENEQSSYERIVKSNLPISERRYAINELVQSVQKRIGDEMQNNDGLYYNSIRKFILDHQDIEVGIVTTNYTEFAKTLTGIEEERIAFVHGKLELFESVKSKHIDSINTFSEDDIVFPFIFIQSGVKPIINATQIHEFEKTAQMIEGADEFFILGYGINSDDEHISNLLRERLRKGKEITCFLYNNTSDNQVAVQNELQYRNGIKFENAANFEKTLNSF